MNSIAKEKLIEDKKTNFICVSRYSKDKMIARDHNIRFKANTIYECYKKDGLVHVLIENNESQQFTIQLDAHHFRYIDEYAKLFDYLEKDNSELSHIMEERVYD